MWVRSQVTKLIIIKTTMEEVNATNINGLSDGYLKTY